MVFFILSHLKVISENNFCLNVKISIFTVGTELVQVGHILYKDIEVEQIEDSLITGLKLCVLLLQVKRFSNLGVLRERLNNVDISSLSSSISSTLWISIFSHCPWLSLTKLTFSNDLVISKSSSRKNVQYVGSVSSPQLWRYKKFKIQKWNCSCFRYFLCLHLEFVLEHLEKQIYTPQSIFDICER